MNPASQVERTRQQNRRGTEELVREAVDRVLDYNQWFKEQVQVGLDQIARGELIDVEEMDARVERILQSRGASVGHRKPLTTSSKSPAT